MLVKIHNDSFDIGYQQGYEERGMISKKKFRFQDNLLARIYNKLRHIRQGGILLHLKLKLGLTSLPEIMRERKKQDENE